MTVRVLLVRGAVADLDCEQRHRGGAQVGKVVEGVGQDGDTVHLDADRQLHHEKQEIAAYPQRAGKPSIGFPHPFVRGGRVVFYDFFDDPTDQLRHLLKKKTTQRVRLTETIPPKARGRGDG